MAGWELREHLHNPATVSHVFRSFAFLNTEFDLRWEPTERRHGAPLGLNPVLQAAERFVDNGRGNSRCQDVIFFFVVVFRRVWLLFFLLLNSLCVKWCSEVMVSPLAVSVTQSWKLCSLVLLGRSLFLKPALLVFCPLLDVAPTVVPTFLL